MNSKRMIVLGIAGALALVGLLLAATGAWAGADERALAAPLAQSGVVSSTISYQGRLLNADGTPVEGMHMMAFRLYGQADGGAPLWSASFPVSVEKGLFHVTLDVDPALFNGQALWLGMQVEGDAEEMTPRQPLLPAPYALHALSVPWTGLTGVPAGLDDGDDDTTYTAGTGLSLVGTQFGVNTSYRLPQSCSSGQIAEWDGSSWGCGDDDTGTGGWSLTGNSGTDPTTDFLGTADGVSLTLAVNGASALRLEPDYTSPNLVGGYGGNSVAPGVRGAVIGGGGNGGYPNQVTADYGTVGGGSNNIAGGFSAAIGGGTDNTASGGTTTVGGGGSNTASGEDATVGGGWGNVVSATCATVSGGSFNTASGSDATVGGGADNTASGEAATVGGGRDNTASGGQYGATVGGGDGNTASGTNATVSGGYHNEASGKDSTAGGGAGNTASGERATVGGGGGNAAGGIYATVGGGYANSANGDYSFAAGRRAKANQPGCFVWGDSTDAQVSCNDANRTIFRSTGGFYIYTNNAATPSGLYLAAGGSSWNTHSDRDVKENFQSVDTQQLLANLTEIPISTWNYKSQNPAIRHVGPMAQDFNTLLPGLGGEGETYINTLDADGVALAAIQGLYAQNQELTAENAALRAEVDDLAARVAALEAAVGTPQDSSLQVSGGWLSFDRLGTLLLGGLVAVVVVVRRRRSPGGGL